MNISIIYKNVKQFIGKEITIYCFLRSIRKSKEIIFLDVYDGTYFKDLQCIIEKKKVKEIPVLHSSLKIKGKLKESCGKQLYEFEIDQLEILNNVKDIATYPLNKTNMKNPIYLRSFPYLRIRTPLFQSIFKIRSTLLWCISQFMEEKGVLRVDPNILTTSDCEGAGEMFKVLPNLFKGNSVGLTVSSQLPLEAFIHGFKRVYTLQKSFRAEKSNTNKHLAEFLHLEYEEAFTTMDYLIEFIEHFIKHCILSVIQKCEKEYLLLKNILKEDIKKKVIDFIYTPTWKKIRFKDAVDLICRLVKNKEKIHGKRVKVKHLPSYTEDLQAEHEKILVDYYQTCVCVTHYPISFKAFYMKQVEDGLTESFDILTPVGECIGGSMRETRKENLLKELKKRNIHIDPWYIQLREQGSPEHGGFGLGVDRLVLLLSGMKHIRDVVPIPMYYSI